MKKTNALRLLDKAKVTYELIEYVYDENDLSGVSIANQIPLPIQAIFKTLVLKGDKTGYLVACISIIDHIDLKKLAKVSNNKKVEMILMKDLLMVTGYIRGGCSPIGMKKAYPMFIDDFVLKCSRIGLSAGVRGLEMIIDSQAFVTYTKINIVKIV